MTTPLARGATGAEPWIDVRINLDDGVRNIPCCLNVEVEPANAAPGQLVRLHATVADRDDDSFAYAWSFDDGTFSTNNSAWTYKTWSQPGEHVARDMKGPLWRESMLRLQHLVQGVAFDQLHGDVARLARPFSMFHQSYEIGVLYALDDFGFAREAAAHGRIFGRCR